MTATGVALAAVRGCRLGSAIGAGLGASIELDPLDEIGRPMDPTAVTGHVDCTFRATGAARPVAPPSCLGPMIADQGDVGYSGE